MQIIVSEEKCRDGQVIYEEGKSGDWVYVVISGSVEISRVVGGKKFIIGELAPGQVFGVLGFLGGIKRTGTARAVGETTVGIINRDFLDEEFNKVHVYFQTILKSVVDRFKEMIDRVTESSSRKHPRIQKSLSLEFQDRDTFIKAFSANIGEGGLFIKTNKPLKKGEQFLLKLQLPDIPDPLKIVSEVVWTANKSDKDKVLRGMGVKFVKMANKDNQLLKQYINAHLMRLKEQLLILRDVVDYAD
jgi:uncharacterized protein (TIGR02266 family)